MGVRSTKQRGWERAIEKGGVGKKKMNIKKSKMKDQQNVHLERRG